MIRGMLYDDLVRALTDPAFALDVRAADLVGLSDEEVGGLLATAYRARPEATDAMKGARTAVHLAVRDREPRYTPDACRRMFEAVVACSEDPDDVVSLRPIVDALVHCTGPWPDLSGPARALTDFLVEKGTPPTRTRCSWWRASGTTRRCGRRPTSCDATTEP